MEYVLKLTNRYRSKALLNAATGFFDPELNGGGGENHHAAGRAIKWFNMTGDGAARL